jgi:hypothetical protein
MILTRHWFERYLCNDRRQPIGVCGVSRVRRGRTKDLRYMLATDDNSGGRSELLAGVLPIHVKYFTKEDAMRHITTYVYALINMDKKARIKKIQSSRLTS